MGAVGSHLDDFRILPLHPIVIDPNVAEGGVNKIIVATQTSTVTEGQRPGGCWESYSSEYGAGAPPSPQVEVQQHACTISLILRSRIVLGRCT